MLVSAKDIGSCQEMSLALKIALLNAFIVIAVIWLAFLNSEGFFLLATFLVFVWIILRFGNYYGTIIFEHLILGSTS
jgi:hypothetical protein